jgi:serine acetyltransferase/thymidylate kinase
MQQSSLLMEFFGLLKERGIQYCVMGDSRQLPDVIGSDVDIVVPQSLLPQLPQLIDTFCSLHPVRLVQCLQHEHNAYYFVLAFRRGNARPEYLALDLCGDYFRRGQKLLTANELLATATPALDGAGREKGFMVCSPAFEFCYYLIKKIDKESLDTRHAEHLTQQWRLDPERSKALVGRFWGDTAETRLLMRAADSGDWTTVARLLPRMRAALHRRLRSNIAKTFLEYARRWRRWRQPTGLLIAAMGPDGCGKSSVIAAADRQVREAFRSTTLVHLRPGFLYRPERMPNNTPHAEKPRGRSRSFFKLVFFAADYVLGYLFFIKPLLVRSNSLIFDRYYDDLLVDPRRYRHKGSLGFARLLRRVVPRPDLWLLLDAPADVLQTRKQEVSPQESARQRVAYVELLSDQKNVVVIDASQSLEAVIRQATDAILARCESQTRARLGICKPTAKPTAKPTVRSPLGARWLLFFCRHRVPLLSKLTRLLFNSDIYCAVPRNLYLPHPYGIVIHSKTRLGQRVTVMQQATLGGKDFNHNVAPIVEDDVYIGAGARVLGAVRIGVGAIVGANAVVTRDIPPYTTVVGANRILDRYAHEAKQDLSALTPSLNASTNMAISASVEADDTVLTLLSSRSGVPHQ